MRELVAKNPATGMVICERFDEKSGTRYFKVTPKEIAQVVIQQLKTQFAKMPIAITESTSGWLMVKKQKGIEDDQNIQEAGKKAAEQLVGNTAFDKEVNMLKAAGFQVEVKEVKG